MPTKARSVQFPYLMRIHGACDRYLERLRDLNDKTQIHNLFVEFRNEMWHVMEEIYQELSVYAKHNIKVKATPRVGMKWPISNPGDRCVICGENRIVDKCHIIPREHSGSSSMDNLILLCPTHHFLFDHGRLSKDEFMKIDVKDKLNDAREYFSTVRLKEHERQWSTK